MASPLGPSHSEGQCHHETHFSFGQSDIASCKGNQFVKLKLLPIFKTNVFELYVHRRVKTVLQIVKR